MIIETTRPTTTRLAGHRDGTDEDGGDGDGDHYAVTFDRTVPADADPADEDTPDVEARRARVPADVGEYLADTYEAVTIHEDERGDDTDDAPADTVGEAADEGGAA